MDNFSSPDVSLFSLNEEQRAIQQMTSDFANDRIAPHAIEWDQKAHLPLDTIRETAALGMGGIYVREDVGGSALSRLEAALIFEALATGCPAFSAFISIHNMASWMIDRFGNEQQRQKFLPKLTSMQWIASYCLTEPGCGSDAAALKTRAVQDGDEYVLNGTKQFISGAGVNEIYLTMVRTGEEGSGGISALVIPKDTKGLSFGVPEKKMGWNMQPTAQVIFEDCRVPVENRIGQEGDGFAIAMSGLDGGRLNIGACSLGGAQSALDKAIAYANERQAFGKSIAGFQAIQFKLADMATELEAARALLYMAAAKFDAGDAEATKYCAMAKRFATDTGFDVANDALQIHGGYGYLAEYGVEKIVRDLRVHQILEGTNEIMRMIIARKII